MPEVPSAYGPVAEEVQATLTRLRQRLRIAAASDAITLGAAGAAMTFIAVAIASRDRLVAAVSALAVYAVLALALGSIWWRGWSVSRVARAIQRSAGGMDNLLVTAEEALSSCGHRVHPMLANELFRQASERLRLLDLGRIASPVRQLLFAAASSIAAAVFVMTAGDVDQRPGLFSSGRFEEKGAGLLDPGTLRVTISPPAYTGRPATTAVDPFEIQALEGSRVRLEIVGARDAVQLVEVGKEPTPFASMGASAVTEIVATASRVLLIRQAALSNQDADRLLQIHVEPDRSPVVRIRAPGRDLLFGRPAGTVAVAIEARDDLGLDSLVLRYTRVGGTGEALGFEEGDVPLRVQRTRGTEWQGHAELSLEGLKLEDGDTLVYRALARDNRPGADPVASEAFLIEVGKRTEAASSGFAVPEDRDRQGISQQMLIIKTERLHAERAKLPPGALLEQSRLLGVEQRMVRAEFIFMTGGEVQDEVEEAEHSDDVLEGRFENEGQREMLNAVRDMSRAEARLNAGDTAQALVLERAALRALQRAFDRRRYFLRTLPERARIDPARRLTGDLTDARSWTRPLPREDDDPALSAIRHVILDLATAVQRREGLDARLAARVVAIDPASRTLQLSAMQIANAASLDDRVKAGVDAQAEVGAHLRRRLEMAPATTLPRDPLLGRFADQLSRPGGPR